MDEFGAKGAVRRKLIGSRALRRSPPTLMGSFNILLISTSTFPQLFSFLQLLTSILTLEAPTFYIAQSFTPQNSYLVCHNECPNSLSKTISRPEGRNVSYLSLPKP